MQPVPPGEAILVLLVIALAIIAVGIEAFRWYTGRSIITRQQFAWRMFGGAVLLILAGMIGYGMIFSGPQWGRSFAYYWATCSLVLLALLIIVRHDMVLTRASLTGVTRQLREDREYEMLKMVQELEARRDALKSQVTVEAASPASAADLRPTSSGEES